MTVRVGDTVIRRRTNEPYVVTWVLSISNPDKPYVSARRVGKNGPEGEPLYLGNRYDAVRG